MTESFPAPREVGTVDVTPLWLRHRLRRPEGGLGILNSELRWWGIATCAKTRWKPGKGASKSPPPRTPGRSTIHDQTTARGMSVHVYRQESSGSPDGEMSKWRRPCAQQGMTMSVGDGIRPKVKASTARSHTMTSTRSRVETTAASAPSRPTG